MLESILAVLAPLLRLLEGWVAGAEIRKENKDVEDFGAALVAGDEHTINKLLAELHKATATPAAISTEGN